ncbi:GTPase activating factor [Sporothrix epigloea]|uniref:GTPase activating factor n=1 Tax=Sporothrix epigloea TaxID=1892477 RepID=A0ABP0D4R3_9PEZI
MKKRSSLSPDRGRDQHRDQHRDRSGSSTENLTPLPQRPQQSEHSAVPQQTQPPQAHQSSSHLPVPSLPESSSISTHLVPSNTNINSQAHIAQAESTQMSAGPAAVLIATAASSCSPTTRAVNPEHFEHHSTTSQDVAEGGGSGNAHYNSSPSSAVPVLSPRTLESATPQGSSMTLTDQTSRRQGVVFNDSISEPFDVNTTLPSPSPRPALFRPRTHTMDSSSLCLTVDSGSQSTPLLQGLPLESLLNSQPAIISPRLTEARVGQPPLPASGIDVASSSVASVSSLGGSLPTSAAASATLLKEKKCANRRLMKRTLSRPTSPLISPPPSVDSLLLPIPTNNANRVLMLMKTLCGRMRGEIEYQSMAEDTWHRGVSYIEEEKGSLMFDVGTHGPFHSAIVPDLRSCRVSVADRSDQGGQFLEVINAQATVDILFRPLATAEFDLWLAALLCWQQLRQAPGIVSVVSSVSKPPISRSTSASVIESSKRRTSAIKVKEGTIIKVGKVMLWDKGTVTSPRAIAKRPSTRDIRPIQPAWRRVSCILQGNGEFKLMTENDVTILSNIELSQLGRCAIQQLDKSVLDEEYCIAIFPIYAPSSTHLSILRPIYIALDSRVVFEVWFVLLRAFTVPEIYELGPSQGDQVHKPTGLQSEQEDAEGESRLQVPDDEFVESGEDARSDERDIKLFRLEKTLNLRVTEAKFKPRILSAEDIEDSQEPMQTTVNDLNQNRFHDRSRDKYDKQDKHNKHEKNEKNEKHRKHDKHSKHNKQDKAGKHSEARDPRVGNYLAEVILNGEVRARTTVKTDTKNPFWREDCDFSDLPLTPTYLSVVLKRVEGNFDSFSHQLQASLGLPKTGNMWETDYGSVDIPLINLDRGKDHEHWLPVCDDRNQAVGSMLVKVHHEELAVLSAKEYLPILDMLHNFSTGLTLQIAEAMPGSLRRLSEVFLNIFQVSGTAGNWLMALVEDEIDGIGNQTTIKNIRFSRRLRSNDSVESTSDREQNVRDMGRSLQGEANLLFRGNSLLTQALEFHMRRLGKEYLTEVLSDKIFEINETNPDCEVDPSKVLPGDDINKHWDQLMAFIYDVWDCIANSALRLPSELRHILKYIRAVAEDRYGDFLRTVTYTSVSGFLFLRFICPAILNPKLFGLLRDHPRPRAQRTLTLMAKSLQALANLSTIGRKETWMEPMNKFLVGQRQSVKNFIDAVCSIPAEKPNMPQALPASYSTPITILGRLTPAAREGFPSLPYLIDHTHNIAALVKMWTKSSPLSTNMYVYDSSLLEFNDACLALQAWSDKCFARADLIRQSSDAECSLPTTDNSTSDPVANSITNSMETLSLAGSTNFSRGSSTTLINMAEPGAPSSGDLGGRRLATPGSPVSDVDDLYGGRDIGSNNSGAGNSKSDNSGQPCESGGSIKLLRNGKQARKFISGIISRKPRAASPEHGSAPSISSGSTQNDGREKDHDHAREREVKERKNWERGRDPERDQDSRSYSGKDRDKEQRQKRDKSVKSENTDRSRNPSLGELWTPASALGVPLGVPPGIPHIPSQHNK